MRTVNLVTHVARTLLSAAVDVAFSCHPERSVRPRRRTNMQPRDLGLGLRRNPTPSPYPSHATIVPFAFPNKQV